MHTDMYSIHTCMYTCMYIWLYSVFGDQCSDMELVTFLHPQVTELNDDSTQFISDSLQVKLFSLCNLTCDCSCILNLFTNQFMVQILASKILSWRFDGKLVENMALLGILNISPFDVDCTFTLLNDESMTTFLLDPVSLQLKPGEKKVSTLINQLLPGNLSSYWCL